MALSTYSSNYYISRNISGKAICSKHVRREEKVIYPTPLRTLDNTFYQDNKKNAAFILQILSIPKNKTKKKEF